MKKNSFVLLLLLSFILPLNSEPTKNTDNLISKKFEIIFVVNDLNDSSELRSDWLDEIKNKWGATGVSLYLAWDLIQLTSNKEYDFKWVDAYIQIILSKNLDLYIRIPFAYHMPAWTNPGSGTFSIEHYQTTKNGNIFEQYKRNPLNFASEITKDYMKDYLKALSEHLHNNYSSSIKEIAPSTSVDAEFEYAYGEMLGYSQPEIEQFREYLRKKYNVINNLNSSWGGNFKNFNEIDPRKPEYNWELHSPQNYYMASGRLDWIDFRQLNLKIFIDECAEIIHSYNFKMGLQLGSVYDDAAENRGWSNPIPLLENVDAIKVADIAEYKAKFSSGADYLKKICDYWKNQNGKIINFSNESNWAYYNNYTSAQLSSDWKSQLETYYYKGSSAHYIFGWSLAPNWINVDSLYKRENSYKNWMNILNTYSGKNIIGSTEN